jgi:hypothetical protein
VDLVEPGLGLWDQREEPLQFLASIPFTEGTVVNASNYSAGPDVAFKAVLEMPGDPRQTTVTVDVLWLDVCAKLLGPAFGYLLAFLVAIVLRSQIGRAFAASETTKGDDLIHALQLLRWRGGRCWLALSSQRSMAGASISFWG